MVVCRFWQTPVITKRRHGVSNMGNEQLQPNTRPVEKCRTIYALHDPRVDDYWRNIFYVGQTTDIHARRWQHLCNGVIACKYANVEPVYRRYRAIIDAGYVPILNPLGTSTDALSDVLKTERAIIELLWQEGIIALNFPQRRRKLGLIAPEDSVALEVAS